jgi:ABC-2 type transport system permease protein
MKPFLWGYAASNDVKNVPLAVYGQDRGPAIQALLEAYRALEYFWLSFDVDSEDEIRIVVDSGQAGEGVIIPPDYTDAFLKWRHGRYHVPV